VEALPPPREVEAALPGRAAPLHHRAGAFVVSGRASELDDLAYANTE